MNVLQRYFAISISQAVALVLLALLALLAFLDLTGELPAVGKGGYGINSAFLFVLLQLPGHVYEMMPVAALLGTIYAMAQFAATSEFTIMRASSMSTARAGLMLFNIGLVFVLLTFLFGEVITPYTTPMAEKMRLAAKGATVSQEFRTGMWTKDIVRNNGISGTVIGSRFFNVREFRNDGQLIDVKLYEFDANFRLRSLITAASASFKGNSTWRLMDVTETMFSNTLELPAPGEPGASLQTQFGQETSVVASRKLASKDLISEITPKILSVAGTDPEHMSASELAVYTRHLADNRQENERFKIAFWKKLIDPFGVLVLMALALPFAYLHMRTGGVSLKIFVGIMIGVTFMLVNTLFSHLGVLSTWPPILTALAPSALFLLLALGALWWVERH